MAAWRMVNGIPMVLTILPSDSLTEAVGRRHAGRDRSAYALDPLSPRRLGSGRRVQKASALREESRSRLVAAIADVRSPRSLFHGRIPRRGRRVLRVPKARAPPACGEPFGRRGHAPISGESAGTATGTQPF
jgi:hypothetical protein